jgi:hypothetical protein
MNNLFLLLVLRLKYNLVVSNNILKLFLYILRPNKILNLNLRIYKISNNRIISLLSKRISTIAFLSEYNLPLLILIVRRGIRINSFSKKMVLVSYMRKDTRVCNLAG